MLALGFLMFRVQLDAYSFACTDNDESGRHITFRLPFTMKQIRKHGAAEVNWIEDQCADAIGKKHG